MLKELKECSFDSDISSIKISLSKKLKEAFRDTYYDFALEYLKHKNKKLILENNGRDDYSFDIVLMK